MDPVEQLRWNLTNHRPTDEAIVDIEALRDAAIAFGQVILMLAPDSREKSLAITKLEETVMWAVASIARNNPAVVGMSEEEIDTTNDFLIGVSGYPDANYMPLLPMRPMGKAEALRFAAWLVALADPLEETFPAVLKAVRST